MNDRLTRETIVPSPAAPREPGRTRAGGVRSNTIVASASSLVSGVLNAGILAYSARRGQTGEIAAYTVMTAALTWIAILIMGGSSLLYATGNEDERRSVRCQRLLLAAPAMAAATVLLAWLYGGRGYGTAALLSAGGVMILNSLAELRFSDLVRQMRFIAASAAMTATRFFALVLLVAGVPLTIALAAGAAAYLATTETLVCCGPSGGPPMWTGLSPSSARRAFRLNRQLFTYSLAEALTGRAGTIALSLVASPHVVGCFGALVSIYQALVAVVFSGLRVPMAVRTRRRHNLGPTGAASREAEVISVTTGAVIAAGVIAWAPWIATGLLGLPIPESAIWLQLLALALPFATVNRAFTLNRIGDGNYRAATRVTVSIAVVVTGGLLVQALTLGPTGVAAATCIAEAAVAGVLVALAASRWYGRTKANGPHTGAAGQDRDRPRPSTAVGR
ncbi:hypothetical protein [Micromonospora sp. DPT]|uniref:lipopolysaccharide biosynthesis protein n=1 Tax=Micromonospora sp. DPT TaxID=3142975 RepID=UPI003208394C